MSTTVSRYIGPKPGTAPLTDEEAAQLRLQMPDDPIKLPPGHLACEGCGVAAAGPTVESIPVGSTGRFVVQFTRCEDCQRLHDAAGDRRTLNVLYALAVIGQRVPEDPTPLVPWMHVVASAVAWLDPEMPSEGLCSPHPWAHVSLGQRAQIKESYLLAMRNRIHLSAPPLDLPPPWGRACLFCGVGSLPMAAIEVARRGGREKAAEAVWRQVTVQPTSLGLRGPSMLTGYLCPPCSEAADSCGAVGVRARARAFEKYVRAHRSAAEADRVRSMLDHYDQINLPGWVALRTRNPNPEPWAHVVVPPPQDEP